MTTHLFPGEFAAAAPSIFDALAYVFAAAAILAAAAVAYVALRISRPERRSREKRRGARQRGPSLSRAPRSSGSPDGRSPDRASAASATLRERGGAGREYPLGLEPAVIGASSAVCTIVLEGDGIAPEHARVWLRGGRYLLHHVGGLSRKTYVSGQEVEWVVLEPGDEVGIGRHRLVLEGVIPMPEASIADELVGRRELSSHDDLTRMEIAVRELWAEASPASETAVGERSGTGKFKVHRRKDELAQRVGGHWVKRGRTVVLER